LRLGGHSLPLPLSRAFFGSALASGDDGPLRDRPLLALRGSRPQDVLVPQKDRKARPDSKGHILFAADPRPGGGPGLVREVNYAEPSDHHDWSDGDARADCCLGVARGDDTVYQAFHSRRECEVAGFHYVTSNYGLYGSW
jgi:hypothetical protein